MNTEHQRCHARGTWVETSDGHRGMITSSWSVGGVFHYTVELELTELCVPYRGDQLVATGAPLPKKQVAGANLPDPGNGAAAAVRKPVGRSLQPSTLAAGPLATTARCLWDSAQAARGGGDGPIAAMALQNLVMIGRYQKGRVAALAASRFAALTGFAVERPGDDTPPPRAA